MAQHSETRTRALILILTCLRFFTDQALVAGEYNTSALAAEEVDALVEFKAQLSLPSQELLSSWDANSTRSAVCESWAGIRCHMNHIQAINLTGLGLAGILAPDLGNLTSISFLDLSSNSFTGSIPPQLSGCTSLQQLSLGNNNLTGSIPSSLSSLSSLQMLNLSMNHLTGHIPNTMLSNITALLKLDLSSNSLTGSLPTHVCTSSDLEWLLLWGNNITGAIPPSIGNCTSLVDLRLFDNQLTGPIPTELGFLVHLEILYLAQNNLTGAIPGSLANCTNLTDLGLSNNQLIGPIPTKLVNMMFRLKALHLHDNKLRGAIPRSVGNCTTLTILELGSNQLTGPIPSEFGMLLGLRWLNIYDNKLTGVIPPSLGNCTTLFYLTLSTNQLVGFIPTELTMLGLLDNLVISFNYLSGFKMPSFSNLSSLTGLDLASNQLSGSIPMELGQLQQLVYLDLGYNGFSNEIPWDSLSNCSYLNYLGLYNNHLSGRIQRMLGRLQRLEYLYLQGNLLQGVIPDFGYSDLHIRLLDVDFSSNRLNGSVPSSLASALSTALIRLDLSHNHFSGSLPSWLGNFQQMQGLVLSYNQFVNTIPESLSTCVGLTALDLSHNLLSGVLPEKLGKLTYLESLDVSNNNLTGALPPSLGSLPNLHFINVSFNNFTGTIPSAGIFKNLNASSLEGNPGLCGPILQKTRIPSSFEKHHHNVHFSWKVILVIALVLLTIGVVLVVLAKYCYHSKCNACLQAETKCLLAEATRYTADELTKATQGYSEENLLGQGGLSAVYKGVLSDGKVVAVKILKEVCSREALLQEVHILSKLRHRNLVKVLGCVFNLDVNALVLEYMSNGSLHQYLHGSYEFMNWGMLINITVGVANALSYLHHEYGVPIIHGDIKPDNILLDSDLEAHLADFGLAKLMKEGAVSVSSNFKGSIGYMAPEYAYVARITTKVDVYSFGVVVLEMLTGKKATQLPESVSLHDWVKSKLNEGASLPEGVLHASLPLSTSVTYTMAVQLLQMGVACTQDQPNDRPAMQQIVRLLLEIKSDYIQRTSAEEHQFEYSHH